MIRPTDADKYETVNVLSLHRCKICGTRWLLWPDSIHGGGWNLLDSHQRPAACCDNVGMGEQIEHLRDLSTQDVHELKQKYDELIFAVGNKCPGESRHETALRYIRRAEDSGGPRTQEPSDV